VRVAAGKATPSAVTVALTCDGTGYEQSFRIAKGDDATWFDVTPKEGVVRSGAKTVFTVTFDAAKMAKETFPKSAFLVRTADGFSRPVTVYAETDHVPFVKCEKPGEVALYGKPGSFTVDVPKDGVYYLLLRGRMLKGLTGRSGEIFADVNLSSCPFSRTLEGASPRFDLRAGVDSWGIETRGEGHPQWYHLKAGPCTVRVWLKDSKDEPKFACTDIVLTDSPGSFDPLVGTPGRKSE